MPFKSRRSLLAALCLSALVPPLAHAQSQPAAWPAKPIRIVVAYPAGGVSDTVARALADKLAVQLGTPVVIENKSKTDWAVGDYLRIYCDAYGTYSAMPWLIARYTYQ